MVASVLDLGRIAHTGLVVRDLRAAMDRYWRMVGIGPWKVHVYETPPQGALYRGRPSLYTARIAVATAGSVCLELTQPLEGESIYSEFIEARGEGLHHIALVVPSLDDALVPFREWGIDILQSTDGIGEKRDGRQAFLDTLQPLGAILELIQPPAEYGIDWIYPA